MTTPVRSAAGLTAAQAAAPRDGLVLTLFWWIPGMLLVGGYYAYSCARMPWAFTLENEDD